MHSELRNIEEKLKKSENQWHWHVAQAISEVPRGYLATYGAIAEVVNQDYHLNIGARNVAWLRKKLYSLLSHNTKVPLHRIAKEGDVESLGDSETTKMYNDRLREEEGSLANPKWWHPQ